MKRLLKLIFKRIGALSYRISNSIILASEHKVSSMQSLRVIPWFKENGDKTHRLKYNLDQNSVVFDLGGYEGEWAAQILCMYGSKLFVFEPYEVYFNNIANKFLKNMNVHVFQFGLASADQNTKLYLAENGSSVFLESKKTADIKLRCAHRFFAEQNIEKVDLMKINIEGGEYDLLEHLIETNDIKKVANIQVQFHDFIPSAEERMKAIQKKLELTHELTYQYEFVWENWCLKR